MSENVWITQNVERFQDSIHLDLYFKGFDYNNTNYGVLKSLIQDRLPIAIKPTITFENNFFNTIKVRLIFDKNTSSAGTPAEEQNAEIEKKNKDDKIL